MRLVIVPSEVAGAREARAQGLTSYLVNDTVAIDAGSIGLLADLDQQARIKHVFLSHTHIDHIATLPILVDNTYAPGKEPITIYGSAAVLECLRTDIFNGRVWPDFVTMSEGPTRLLQLRTLEANRPVAVDGLTIVPVPVEHVVPTFGFIIRDGGAAIAISSDTGPTDAIWALANQTANLKAVFLEATFPDSMAWLAAEAKHLTPASFAEEVRKIKGHARIIAVHVKPRCQAEMARELAALDLPEVEIARYGEPYEF